jgi:hypothetical protein
MRRPRTTQRAKRTADIRKDMTESQLAGIGAVALAYNEVDSLIDVGVSLALHLWPGVAHEVTSRIFGVESKIELLKLALRDIGASEEVQWVVAQIVGKGEFLLFKKYRDAVIHARVLDAAKGIAIFQSRKAQMEEVLLTAEALNGLYERLRIMRLELVEVCNIIIRLMVVQKVDQAEKILAPTNPNAARIAVVPRSQTEQDIQAVFARVQRYRNQRLSLPPLPAFPAEPPTSPTTEGPTPLASPDESSQE